VAKLLQAHLQRTKRKVAEEPQAAFGHRPDAQIGIASVIRSRRESRPTARSNEPHA